MFIDPYPIAHEWLPYGQESHLQYSTTIAMYLVGHFQNVHQNEGVFELDF